MPEPMRLKAQFQGDKTTVRVLMSHDMETGFRKDANGQTVPAWFIQQVTARLNGQIVLTAQWGPAVARNPFLQFNLRAAKPGDRVAIHWLDNRGEQRSDETVVV
jgi:sulfur-oxidizing protein SoxZ